MRKTDKPQKEKKKQKQSYREYKREKALMHIISEARRSRLKERIKKPKGNAVGVICIGFVILILIGTVILSLPISSADRTFTNPIDALFTATSAGCVTGLTTLTTASHWSMFGKIVIISLIQVGGLGFMTMALMASNIVKRAVTPKNQMLLAVSYNLDSYESIKELTRRVVIGTFSFELIGAIILFVRFSSDYSTGKAIFMSVFTSISAFCNAGFDIIGDTSVTVYADDLVVMLTLTALIMFGGIGFVVWNELVNAVRRKKSISVYSKFVLTVSAFLILGGALLFAVLEWNNEGTIGNMPIWQKIIDSLFQSMTYRTAGFYIFDNAAMTKGAKIMALIWMFIGGASGSTAGGVKIATIGVLFYTVACVAFGKRDVVVFGRKIGQDSYVRASAIVTVQLTVIFIATTLLCTVEDVPLIDSLFEATSAISTVGLSLGVTSTLGVFGKLLVALLMYFGRVGVISITCAVAVNMSRDESCITYPDANFMIG